MAKRWFAALNEWTTKERPETGRQRQRLKQLGMVQEDAHDVQVRSSTCSSIAPARRAVQ
jgi:hypothetical protein